MGRALEGCKFSRPLRNVNFIFCKISTSTTLHLVSLSFEPHSTMASITTPTSLASFSSPHASSSKTPHVALSPVLGRSKEWAVAAVQGDGIWTYDVSALVLFAAEDTADSKALKCNHEADSIDVNATTRHDVHRAPNHHLQHFSRIFLPCPAPRGKGRREAKGGRNDRYG